MASVNTPPGKGEVFIVYNADPNTSMCILSCAIKKAGWIIKSVVIFNEALFEGESFAVHPSQSTNIV